MIYISIDIIIFYNCSIFYKKSIFQLFSFLIYRGPPPSPPFFFLSPPPPPLTTLPPPPPLTPPFGPNRILKTAKTLDGAHIRSGAPYKVFHFLSKSGFLNFFFHKYRVHTKNRSKHGRWIYKGKKVVVRKLLGAMA